MLGKFFGGEAVMKILRKILQPAKMLFSMACVFGSFLLGWCSFTKMKAYMYERVREYYRSYLRKKGKLNITTYNGKRILTLDEANQVIADAIKAGKPFMAARYGSELRAVWRTRDDGRGFILPIRKILKSVCSHTGFFPEDKKALIKFSEVMKWASPYVDLIGVFHQLMEEYSIRTYCNNPQYTLLGYLEPYFSNNPWSAALEGKKVVVIHPFDKTIQSQYKKRELLFPGTNILPEFELRTVRAVQTLADQTDERFVNWFEALDWMFNEAMKEDFDVAIIGCGAYGFPLAAKIKQAGKISIHLGGGTQLLFGIKGRRWEVEQASKFAKLLDNPAWVRPSEDERPKGAEKVEEACYW